MKNKKLNICQTNSGGNKNNSRYFLSIILMGMALLFFQCVSPMGMSASSTSLQNKIIEKNLGKISADVSKLSYIGIPGILGFSLDLPEIQEAIKIAIKKKKADALINISWHQKNTYLLLVTYTTIVVTGEAVKFEKIKISK